MTDLTPAELRALEPCMAAAVAELQRQDPLLYSWDDWSMDERDIFRAMIIAATGPLRAELAAVLAANAQMATENARLLTVSEAAKEWQTTRATVLKDEGTADRFTRLGNAEWALHHAVIAALAARPGAQP